MSDEVLAELLETHREIRNTLKHDEFVECGPRFCRMLTQGMVFLNLDDLDLSVWRDAVTMDRWIDGESLPCLSVRRHILQVLGEKIEQRIRWFEKQRSSDEKFDCTKLWNIDRLSPSAMHDDRMAWYRAFAERHAPR